MHPARSHSASDVLAQRERDSARAYSAKSSEDERLGLKVMRVRCSRAEHEGTQYSDLTIGNVYRVLGIEADFHRIIGDEGRPYLYPDQLFETVDPAEDPAWITTFGNDGERYSYPQELSAPGFFEDYFDNRADAVATFREYAARMFRP